MRLNQTVRYGIACLFELAKCWGEYLDANLIATRQQIPAAYAHKILQSMAHAGLVFAQKGIGYRLARPLSEITALEVLQALTKDSETHLSHVDIGTQFEQRINQVLDNVSLGELQEASL